MFHRASFPTRRLLLSGWRRGKTKYVRDLCSWVQQAGYSTREWNPSTSTGEERPRSSISLLARFPTLQENPMTGRLPGRVPSKPVLPDSYEISRKRIPDSWLLWVEKLSKQSTLL